MNLFGCLLFFQMIIGCSILQTTQVDEIDHIFLRNEDGSTKDLTPDKGAKAGFYGWSNDLKSFFYGFNKKR